MKYQVNKILNDDLCIDIISKFHKKTRPASVGKGKADSVNTEIRTSSALLLSQDEINSISEPLLVATEHIDEPSDEFQLDVQFAEYSVGEFYTWHTDIWTDDYFDQQTTTILLNEDFEGGEFQIYIGDENEEWVREQQDNLDEDYIETYNLKIGESINIPAHNQTHRVKPVTQGIRYSLTIWTYINTQLRDILHTHEAAAASLRS